MTCNYGHGIQAGFRIAFASRHGPKINRTQKIRIRLTHAAGHMLKVFL